MIMAGGAPLQWRDHLLLPNKVGEVSAQRTEGSLGCDEEHDPSGPSGHLPTRARGEANEKTRHWSGAPPAEIP
jgi:hypothetical protein